MTQGLWWRWSIIAVVLFICVVWSVPNFVDTEKIWWPIKDKMVMGLDIQGGSHLVLRVDTESALKVETQRYANEFKTQSKEQKQVELAGLKVIDPLRGSIELILAKAEDQDPVAQLIEKNYSNFVISQKSQSMVKVEFTEYFLQEFKTRLVEQSILTIRNRIDEFGVAEPSISAQGADRILVQLPGIKDASQAKDLINRTAKLDFMIVSHEMDEAKLREIITKAEETGKIKLGDMKYSAYIDQLNLLIKDQLPKDTLVFFEKAPAAETLEAGWIPILLKKNELVSGDRLIDARVSYNQDPMSGGRPIVSFQMDATGSREFGDLTGRNHKQLLAIVLDKVVKSAPVINSTITSHGMIELGGDRDIQKTMAEAKVIATALRAGALPATLEQLEERTVGPSLGRDAIQKGKIATLASCAAVFLFMFLFYRGFGMIANFSLAFNLLIIVSVLSGLGATLTLPGVAGMALTVGISVDACVIIYERIKEEMTKGASLQGAIKEGYDRAFSSILDANLTSIAVCGVLIYYGTGPVRGFAVTLITGLIVTMFTGVFFTRALLDLLVVRWKWNLAVRW